MAIFKSEKLGQVDYKLTYWPRHMLGTELRKYIFEDSGPRAIRKGDFLAGCNKELTHFTNLGHTYKCVWLFNNIPNEDEWVRKSDSYLLSVSTRQFRHADREDVIILSFCSPTEAAAINRRGQPS